MAEERYRVYAVWESDYASSLPNKFYLAGPEKPKRHARWLDQGISWIAETNNGFKGWSGGADVPSDWPKPIAKLWAKKILTCCEPKGKFTVHLEKIG